MKSFVKCSRFVQPKRYVSTDEVVREDLTYVLPVEAHDDQQPLDEIEDVLSNLEQFYDSSTVKWSIMRRLEDTEHNLMRGLVASTAALEQERPRDDVANAASVCPHPSHRRDGYLQPELTCSIDNSSVDDEDVVVVNGYREPVESSPQHMSRADSEQNKLGMFVLWILLQLFGLWISSSFRVSLG